MLNLRDGSFWNKEWIIQMERDTWRDAILPVLFSSLKEKSEEKKA